MYGPQYSGECGSDSNLRAGGAIVGVRNETLAGKERVTWGLLAESRSVQNFFFFLRWRSLLPENVTFTASGRWMLLVMPSYVPY